MRMSHRILLLFLFVMGQGFSQDRIKEIQSLIEEDSLEKAKTEVARDIAHYKAVGKPDSLFRYIQFEGSVTLNNGNRAEAIKKAQTLTEYIKQNAAPHFIVEALNELGWIYDNAGKDQKVYDLLETAIPYAKQSAVSYNTDLANLVYRRGYFAAKMGNFPVATQHYQEALALLKKSGKKDYPFYHKIYNALGGMMWQKSELDSANYFFQKAIQVLEKTDKKDLINRHYRPALVKMNLAVLLNALGQNSEAISTSEAAIAGFQAYIAGISDEGQIFQAKTHQCVAIDNMATFHNTLGEHKRAQELIEYSFIQKKQLFDANDINLIISNIILSEAKIASRDFTGAAENADRALKLLKTSPGANLYWDAAALITRAAIYDAMGDVDNAAIYYEKAEIAYRQTLGADHTKDFLDNLLEYSLFAAKNQKKEKALSLAQETYDFTHQGDFKNTLQELHHTINLSQVHYLLKNYSQAETYSEEALCFNTLRNGEKISTTDSILGHYRKPQALLINSAAKYYQKTDRNIDFLQNLLQRIEEGIAILDHRKKVVTTFDDVNLLIAENEDLLGFAKKLRLELYQLTGDEIYLDKLIALHESSIYNRIRSRLNLRENLAFQHIPVKVMARESHLKKRLSLALHENEENNIHSYFKASKDWKVFLDSLKHQYPKYYNMRYATLEHAMTGYQQKIPRNTSVVRYIFINDDLYVLVVSTSSKKIVKLDYAKVRNHIAKLQLNIFAAKETSHLYHELYDALWAPIANDLNTSKVVIIPDGDLFNLSFETLTPDPISDFREMATNSLLSEYDISYNFSLLLYMERNEAKQFSSEYIAFAPGFGDTMKETYKTTVKDSIKLDMAYLTLLPQPFSAGLVKEYAEIFGGEHFINENASKEHFINRAKEHKIIHIGTHAESNNISPERSRLIFAKNRASEGKQSENSLYSYEIYNIDLSSNLSILTACETGKPTYRAGEGMISLAHAFNYAGSESIVTSLWKIDEESSVKIIRLLYENLSKGMPKDKALREAKLRYLTTAEGRTAAPQYWAGLVLIGDPASIDLSTGIAWWQYVLVGIVALGAIIFVIKRKNTPPF